MEGHKYTDSCGRTCVASKYYYVGPPLKSKYAHGYSVLIVVKDETFDNRVDVKRFFQDGQTERGLLLWPNRIKSLGNHARLSNSVSSRIGNNVGVGSILPKHANVFWNQVTPLKDANTNLTALDAR